MPSRNVESVRRRCRCDERGTALVEFAFVLPLLLALVLGIVDFGRALNYYIDQTQISAEGARYLAVNRNPCVTVSGPTPECPSGTATPLLVYLKKSVETKEQANSVTGVTVCVHFPNGSPPKAGDPVQVTAALPFKWLFLFEKGPSMNIQGMTTTRLELKPSLYTAPACYT